MFQRYARGQTDAQADGLITILITPHPHRGGVITSRSVEFQLIQATNTHAG